MDFNNAEKIVESGKKRPKKTLITIIVLIILAAVIAYVQGFFGEKAKQHAGSPDKSKAIVPAAGEKQSADIPIRVEQKTEGDQSPAVVSDGDVNINFGEQKKRPARVTPSKKKRRKTTDDQRKGSGRIEQHTKGDQSPSAEEALEGGDYENEVDRAIKKLKKANIVFDSPSSMHRKSVNIINLILSPNEDIGKLLQKLDSAEKESDVIKFSTKMKARLIGENKDAFEIVPIRPEVQLISLKNTTHWKWDVTPLESGRQYLHLTLTALILESEFPIVTYDKEIQVEVIAREEIQNFIAENWKWILGSLFFPFIAWFWKSKFQKKLDNNGKQQDK